MNLTKSERLVLLFLIISCFVGLSINFIRASQERVDLRIVESELTGKEKHFDSLIKEAKMVNINQATIEQFVSLPGIGPSLAERIISFRGSQGLFKSIEEITKVTGIGPKKFEAIKEFLEI